MAEFSSRPNQIENNPINPEANSSTPEVLDLPLTIEQRLETKIAALEIAKQQTNEQLEKRAQAYTLDYKGHIYNVEKILSKGGMGVVLRGTNPEVPALARQALEAEYADTGYDQLFGSDYGCAAKIQFIPEGCYFQQPNINTDLFNKLTNGDFDLQPETCPARDIVVTVNNQNIKIPLNLIDQVPARAVDLLYDAIGDEELNKQILASVVQGVTLSDKIQRLQFELQVSGIPAEVMVRHDNISLDRRLCTDIHLGGQRISMADRGLITFKDTLQLENAGNFRSVFADIFENLDSSITLDATEQAWQQVFASGDTAAQSEAVAQILERERNTILDSYAQTETMALFLQGELLKLVHDMKRRGVDAHPALVTRKDDEGNAIDWEFTDVVRRRIVQTLVLQIENEVEANQRQHQMDFGKTSGVTKNELRYPIEADKQHESMLLVTDLVNVTQKHMVGAVHGNVGDVAIAIPLYQWETNPESVLEKLRLELASVPIESLGEFAVVMENTDMETVKQAVNAWIEQREPNRDLLKLRGVEKVHGEPVYSLEGGVMEFLDMTEMMKRFQAYGLADNDGGVKNRAFLAAPKTEYLQLVEAKTRCVRLKLQENFADNQDTLEAIDWILNHIEAYKSAADVNSALALFSHVRVLARLIDDTNIAVTEQELVQMLALDAVGGTQDVLASLGLQSRYTTDAALQAHSYDPLSDWSDSGTGTFNFSDSSLTALAVSGEYSLHQSGEHLMATDCPIEIKDPLDELRVSDGIPLDKTAQIISGRFDIAATSRDTWDELVAFNVRPHTPLYHAPEYNIMFNSGCNSEVTFYGGVPLIENNDSFICAYNLLKLWAGLENRCAIDELGSIAAARQSHLFLEQRLETFLTQWEIHNENERAVILKSVGEICATGELLTAEHEIFAFVPAEHVEAVLAGLEALIVRSQQIKNRIKFFTTLFTHEIDGAILSNSIDRESDQREILTLLGVSEEQMATVLDGTTQEYWWRYDLHAMQEIVKILFTDTVAGDETQTFDSRRRNQLHGIIGVDRVEQNEQVATLLHWERLFDDRLFNDEGVPAELVAQIREARLLIKMIKLGLSQPDELLNRLSKITIDHTQFLSDTALLPQIDNLPLPDELKQMAQLYITRNFDLPNGESCVFSVEQLNFLTQALLYENPTNLWNTVKQYQSEKGMMVFHDERDFIYRIGLIKNINLLGICDALIARKEGRNYDWCIEHLLDIIDKNGGTNLDGSEIFAQAQNHISVIINTIDNHYKPQNVSRLMIHAVQAEQYYRSMNPAVFAFVQNTVLPQLIHSFETYDRDDETQREQAIQRKVDFYRALTENPNDVFEKLVTEYVHTMWQDPSTRQATLANLLPAMDGFEAWPRIVEQVFTPIIDSPHAAEQMVLMLHESMPGSTVEPIVDLLIPQIEVWQATVDSPESLRTFIDFLDQCYFLTLASRLQMIETVLDDQLSQEDREAMKSEIEALLLRYLDQVFETTNDQSIQEYVVQAALMEQGSVIMEFFTGDRQYHDRDGHELDNDALYNRAIQSFITNYNPDDDDEDGISSIDAFEIITDGHPVLLTSGLRIFVGHEQDSEQFVQYRTAVYEQLLQLDGDESSENNVVMIMIDQLVRAGITAEDIPVINQIIEKYKNEVAVTSLVLVLSKFNSADSNMVVMNYLQGLEQSAQKQLLEQIFAAYDDTDLPPDELVSFIFESVSDTTLQINALLQLIQVGSSEAVTRIEAVLQRDSQLQSRILDIVAAQTVLSADIVTWLESLRTNAAAREQVATILMTHQLRETNSNDYILEFVNSTHTQEYTQAYEFVKTHYEQLSANQLETYCNILFNHPDLYRDLTGFVAFAAQDKIIPIFRNKILANPDTHETYWRAIQPIVVANNMVETAWGRPLVYEFVRRSPIARDGFIDTLGQLSSEASMREARTMLEQFTLTNDQASRCLSLLMNNPEAIAEFGGKYREAVFDLALTPGNGFARSVDTIVSMVENMGGSAYRILARRGHEGNQHAISVLSRLVKPNAQNNALKALAYIGTPTAIDAIIESFDNQNRFTPEKFVQIAQGLGMELYDRVMQGVIQSDHEKINDILPKVEKQAVGMLLHVKPLPAHTHTMDPEKRARLEKAAQHFGQALTDAQYAQFKDTTQQVIWKNAWAGNESILFRDDIDAQGLLHNMMTPAFVRAQFSHIDTPTQIENAVAQTKRMLKKMPDRQYLELIEQFDGLGNQELQTALWKGIDHARIKQMVGSNSSLLGELSYERVNIILDIYTGLKYRQTCRPFTLETLSQSENPLVMAYVIARGQSDAMARSLVRQNMTEAKFMAIQRDGMARAALARLTFTMPQGGREQTMNGVQWLRRQFLGMTPEERTNMQSDLSEQEATVTNTFEQAWEAYLTEDRKQSMYGNCYRAVLNDLRLRLSDDEIRLKKARFERAVQIVYNDMMQELKFRLQKRVLNGALISTQKRVLRKAKQSIDLHTVSLEEIYGQNSDFMSYVSTVFAKTINAV